MRTIGLLGGMSWESTAEYYRLINRHVRAVRGPTASAQCLLWSFDFAEIERLQHEGDWGALAARLGDAGRRLAEAGADFLVLCTNTMHRLADEIEQAAGIGLLHIADVVARAALANGRHTLGLLGTAFTMEQSFYRERMEAHGLSMLIPGVEDRAEIHRIIYQELIAGQTLGASRETYKAAIDLLVEAGADGIVLGCTEIGLLIGPEDSPVPIYDTTALHAAEAVRVALGEVPLPGISPAQ